MKKTVILYLIPFLAMSCTFDKSRRNLRKKSSLSAWNDTESFKTIKNFVDATVDPKSSSYVEPEERYATFDLDGTLMLEMPLPIAGLLSAEMYADQAKKHPEYKETKAYKLIKEGKAGEIYKLPYKEMAKALISIVTLSGEGYSLSELRERTQDFIDDGVVKKFNLPYANATYKPVVQMVDYLTSKGYKVYACTGSPTQMVQAFSEEVLHIPADRVIGTRLQAAWNSDKKEVVIEKGIFPPLNDSKYKPVNISNMFPVKPVIAFGNSDGDMQMFEYAKSRKGPSLAVLVHHNDDVRDFSYTNFTENALKAAKPNSWVVVKSKYDFKQVFMVPNSKLSH